MAEKEVSGLTIDIDSVLKTDSYIKEDDIEPVFRRDEPEIPNFTPDPMQQPILTREEALREARELRKEKLLTDLMK